MNFRCRTALLIGSLLLVSASPAFPATFLEREFKYGPERFSLSEQQGITDIQVEGATRDFTPGHPDMPWLGEEVRLPEGMKLVGVEVLSFDSQPLVEHARLASAIRPTPGLGRVERTTPDPAYFSRSGFQPEAPVRLGYQGWERGLNVAWLQVCPVRWDAQSGRLERISRVRVRLKIEPGFQGMVPRERIVPEWEDDPALKHARGAGISSESMTPSGLKKAQPFRATQIPSLLGSPVAYVIITNDAMASEFQRLADWKTQRGVPAVVRTLSFIQAQYPGASDDADRIRRFIRDAYSRWGTKWVLLGGDTDVLATRYARTTYYGGEFIACDMYYSCLDGNWDADGDELYGEGDPGDGSGDQVDLLPEVWVGRAPVSSVSQAQQFVDKSIQYVRQPVGDYEDRFLFFAEVLFPQNWSPGQNADFDGAEMAEDVTPYIRGVPGLHYARLYENYTDARWEPGALPESRAAVLDSLDRGYNISVHIGHGYRNVMSCGDANLVNSDALGLTNGNRLTNLYAINCTSNAIDFPCIGEAFLHAANGGAVTNIGSSRLDFPAGGRNFEKEYFKAVFQNGVNAVGEAQGKQKIPFVPFSGTDGINRWTQMSLLLLGDPELRMYLGRPKTLTVGHPTSIPLSDNSIPVDVSISGSPVAGALVVAYKPGDEYQTGTTDGSGHVNLPFRADSVGTLTLTVTAANAKPYQATITLTAASIPVLGDLPASIDDDNVGGTVGDSDGLFDAGEIVDLHVSVRNNGGSSAPSVVGTLSSTDPLITIQSATVNYGTIAAGGTSSPSAGFRVTTPFTAPDQHEFAFKLTLADGASHTWNENFQVTLHAPELRHFSHVVQDVGGNNDGQPDPGETVTYLVKLKNLGTGGALSVSAKLRSPDGLSTVTDSTASWGSVAAGEEKQGDGVTFIPTNANAQLELHVFDQYGELFVQTLNLSAPDSPTNVGATGAASNISLTWQQSVAADLLGYNVYRSSSQGGPFTKSNVIPTERISYYLDDHLPPLTRFYYQVSAVDSSGNESARSAVTSASTNPPNHAIFPIPMGQGTISSVAVDHLYSGFPMNIAAGANVLYLWNPDGSAPIDADGAGATSGDFTTRGHNYEAGPSFADLNGDGLGEIIAPAQDSIYVFDQQGQVRPGWPVVSGSNIWSSAAVGDLNNDGNKELMLGTNGNRFLVLRSNGTDWIDGDSNPSTIGVFKVLPTPFNFGTPAIADLDNNGVRDIIYGGFDGRLYAWRPDGSNLPGFPVLLPGPITASVAVGYLDGPGDPELDIVVITGSLLAGPDSVYAFRANGARRPGWPKGIPTEGNTKTPSPALADIDGDGFLDIVCASTNGGLYVFNRNGAIIPPFNNLRYSTLAHGASESSPVVADINGDGINDIVIGDDNGVLTAFSGTGTILPGFPIQLEAEVKSTPALCDCDGDGKTEIAVAGYDKNLYLWDYDFPFSPNGQPPWPQFHHDAQRTGLASNPAFVGVNDPLASLRTASLDLARPAPNPTQGRTRFWYAIPRQDAGKPFELAVFDLSGRRLQTVDRGIAKAGRFSAEWNLRERAGSAVGPGVYFVRLTLGGENRSQKFVVVH